MHAADSSQQGKVKNPTTELVLVGKVPSVRRTRNCLTKVSVEVQFPAGTMTFATVAVSRQPLMGIADSLPRSKEVGA
jgi:hypothetical protein